MSSSPGNRARRSLARQLTFWYAGIFCLTSLVAFIGLDQAVTHLIYARVDSELGHEFSELANIFRAKGLDALRQSLQLEVQADGVDQVFFRLLERDGTVLAATGQEGWGEIPVDMAAVDRLRPVAPMAFANAVLKKEGHPVRSLYGLLDDQTILQVLFSQKAVSHFLAVFRNVVLVALLLLTGVSSCVGWLLTRKALRGVEVITRTAQEISARDLGRRVEVGNRDDEIELLATTFNTMLDRIESLVGGMHELTDNIAHDLRSPIARMRVMAEGVLTSPAGAERQVDFPARIVEECDLLLQMINAMLDISEAEAGISPLAIGRFDLVELVLTGCELFEPLAEQQGMEIRTDLPPSLFVEGDPQKLQRVVANLLDNGLKYAADGGCLQVRLQREEETAVLEVIDNGPGIPPEQLPHIFERFYRGDKSRNRPGTGLGLCLARALCRAHGGDLTAVSRPGHGSRFSVTLPLHHA